MDTFSTNLEFSLKLPALVKIAKKGLPPKFPVFPHKLVIFVTQYSVG